MTHTEAIAELESLFDQRSRIKQLISNIEAERAAAVATSAAPTDSIHVTGGHRGDSRTEFHVLQAEMLYHEYLAAVDTYLDNERSISKTLDLMDDWRLRGLLHYRYVCGYIYDRIEEKMEITTRQLRRLYHPAIDAYCILRSASQTAGN